MGLKDGSLGADFYGGTGVGGGYGYITGLSLTGTTSKWTIAAVVRICDSGINGSGNGAYIFGSQGADTTNDKKGLGIRLANTGSYPVGLNVTYGSGSAVANAFAINQFGISCNTQVIVLEYDGTSNPSDPCQGVPCFTAWLNTIPLITENVTVSASNSISICTSTVGTGTLTDPCHGIAVAHLYVWSDYIPFSAIAALQLAAGS
jgi:hypothetical protein